MRTRTGIAVLLVAAIAGCVARGTQPVLGPAEAMVPAPELGLIVDEKMQVVDMMPLGAAAQAGVQVGDILVSIEPAPPLPPGQEEPTPYPIPLDVLPIIMDEQGNILEPTLVPGEAMVTPRDPLAIPTPVPTLTPAPGAGESSTPEVIDPEATATAEAMQAAYLAARATELAEEEQKAYDACLADAATDPVLSEDWCLPPGGAVLTDTVYFTDTPRIEWKFHRDIRGNLNRMMLTVLRDGQAVKIEVMPGRPQWDRPDQPDRDPEATVTPFPPSYRYY